MSTRRERPTNANRLSQVLAAGMERKLSLNKCFPCVQPVQPVQSVQKHAAAAAATDLLLDYESEEQMREAGARFLATEPDSGPFDPVSYDEFKASEREDGRDRDPTRVMILGCGHAFTIATVRKHNMGRTVAMCPLMRTHQGGENGNYVLDSTEQAEIGFVPASPGEIRQEYGNGDTDVFVDSPDGEVLVRSEFEDGTTKYFEGAYGEERVVRIEYADGDTAFFEGPRDEPYMVRMRSPDGTVRYYEGGPDNEALVRIEYPNGNTEFYQGQAGEERRVSGG